MSETGNQHTTRRGVLFGTVGAMALTAPAVAAEMATHPDAALIAACDELNRIERGFLGFFHGPAKIHDEAEQDAAIATYDREGQRAQLVEVINTTPARTMEGVRAKARVILTEDLELRGKEDRSTIASLLRDIVGNYDPLAIVEGRA